MDNELVMSFWIDTDGYSDRDREMFVCGVEFEMLHRELLAIKEGLLIAAWPLVRNIHRENESRVRLMCGKIGISCEIAPHSGYEGCETWSYLRIYGGN